MYRDFGTVLFAAIVAVIFVIVPLVIQWLEDVGIAFGSVRSSSK